MTNAEKDLEAIKKWCGSDFPYCFDVEVVESDGYSLTTEIAGGKENECDESYTFVKDWEEIDDMCKRGAIKRHGFRIKSIFNYQTLNPIIYRGSKQ